MKKSIALLTVIATPMALFASIPVQNITDHCFCDLSARVPHCRIREQHQMTVQFATGSDGSEKDNCVFNGNPITAGDEGSTDYVSCEKESAVIEWRDVNNADDAYYISADQGGAPNKLDIIAVQTVNQKNERMLVPLTLDASLVVDKPNSCHLLLSSRAIKDLL